MNTNKIIKQVTDEIVETTDINTIEDYLDKDEFKIKLSRKTIENVVRWSINGADTKEIAKNLELTEKQFNMLVAFCPALMWAMQEGSTLSELVITASAYQKAIGGKKRRREVLSYEVETEYDSNGKITSQKKKPTKVVLWEEEPADSSLLKYFMENKQSDNFGESKKEIDEDRYKNIIRGMSENDKEALMVASKGELLEEIKGK